MRSLLFYDSEFTGLTQDTSLISLSMVDENDRAFYAEFSDYEQSKVDEFVRDNVLAHTRWLSKGELPNQPQQEVVGPLTAVIGDTNFVRESLLQWLDHYAEIEVWADHVSYDWVLFCELFGGALSLPKKIYYIPKDLCTLLACRGIDPDINRIEFAQDYLTSASHTEFSNQHNAYFDAQVLQACYKKLRQAAEK